MKKILLLEDDPFIANIYSELVSSEGYELELVTTTAELLAKIKTATPNLIMLDILMSHQNGMHVLEQLHNDPKTAVIPVVILTNLNDDKMKAEAMSLGAKAWFVKGDHEPIALIDKILGYAK